MVIIFNDSMINELLGYFFIHISSTLSTTHNNKSDRTKEQ